MLIDEELRGLKRFYLEIISFIEKLGKSREGSKESPEQIGWMIREKLKRAEMSLERLFIELDDVEDEEKRLKYKNVSDRLKEDLKMARIDFRKALLKSSKNSNIMFQKNQEQILGDGKERIALLQKKGINMKSTTGDRAINTSTNVLSALAELHQLMESEMSKSSVTLEELELSSNALQSLQENYLTFNSLITKSRRLISELEYSNKFDRISIICSLIFFLSVIAWIIYRRLLRHIIHFIFWLFFDKLKNIGKKIIKTQSKFSEDSIIQKSKAIFSYSKNYTTELSEFNTMDKSNIANSKTFTFIFKLLKIIDTFLHDEL